eukprot:362779-Chlamydomonas_euryale.AAC.1
MGKSRWCVLLAQAWHGRASGVIECVGEREGGAGRQGPLARVALQCGTFLHSILLSCWRYSPLPFDCTDSFWEKFAEVSGESLGAARHRQTWQAFEGRLRHWGNHEQGGGDRGLGQGGID